MKTLFLSWQNPVSRDWFPVGRLTYDGQTYRFGYIQGAIDAQQKGSFSPIWSFPNLHHIYESLELFPLFANRLLRQSRPDYSDFVQWLNIPLNEDDPIALLARSGGQRATDTFEVFPCPERKDNGKYYIHFLTHGLRHLPAENEQRVHRLQPNERLYLAHDSQNPFDSKALMLRTEDKYIVGYCPRYLVNDFFNLLARAPKKLEVVVERVNPAPTPLQFRLLCNLSAEWSADFEPFSDWAYQPLVPEEAVSAVTS